MKIDGINGAVTAEGHDKWIDCSSMQWGVGRAISSTAGATRNREASQPSISEMTVTTEMTEASPYVFLEAVVGKGKTVNIHLVQTGAGGTLETYMEYDLENCMVSGYSVSSGGDRPSESISLSFTKLVMRYKPTSVDRSSEAQIPAGYDLTLAKKV
jgi:type VI secretion system secreted protein Hcp